MLARARIAVHSPRPASGARRAADVRFPSTRALGSTSAGGSAEKARSGMSLQGDLSTLELTSLFQKLEGARNTRLLTVSASEPLARAGDAATQRFFEGR